MKMKKWSGSQDQQQLTRNLTYNCTSFCCVVKEHCSYHYCHSTKLPTAWMNCWAHKSCMNVLWTNTSRRCHHMFDLPIIHYKSHPCIIIIYVQTMICINKGLVGAICNVRTQSQHFGSQADQKSTKLNC